MLYYIRIDISKRIDLTKSNKSKECMIYDYWFFNHEFKFQGSICNTGTVMKKYSNVKVRSGSP